jgi:hypothetical protein
MIEYRESIDEISPDQLSGFFVGWPSARVRILIYGF